MSKQKPTTTAAMVRKRPSGPRLRSGTQGLLEALASDTSSEDEFPLQDPAAAAEVVPGSSSVVQPVLEHPPSGSLPRAGSHSNKASQTPMPHTFRGGHHSIVTHFSAASSSAFSAAASATAKGKASGVPPPWSPHPSAAASSSMVLEEGGSSAARKHTAGPYSARGLLGSGDARVCRESREAGGPASVLASSGGDVRVEEGAYLDELPGADESPRVTASRRTPSALNSSECLGLEEQSLNSSGSIRCSEQRVNSLRSRRAAVGVSSATVLDSHDVDLSRDTTESIPSLEVSEVNLLRSCFMRADANKSGNLDLKQFGVLCNLLMKESASSSNDVFDTSPDIVPDDGFDWHTIEFVFRVLDTSRTGLLSLRDYVAGSAILCHANLRQRLLYLFRFADTENRESLSEDNLMVLINAVFTVVVTSPGHKWGFPINRPPEGRWSRLYYASGVLSLDYNPDTLRERARRYMADDGRLYFESFKAWAAEEPAFCAWVVRLGSRGNKAVRRVRVARERNEFVTQMAQLGFSEQELSLGKFAAANSAADEYTLTDDAGPSVAGEVGGDSDLSMGGPLRPSRSTTFGGGTAASDGSGPASMSAGFHASARQSSFEIDFGTLELERRIGEGTFAEVWAGRWLEAPVAVKVFKSRTSAVAMYQLRKHQNAPVMDGAIQLNRSLGGTGLPSTDLLSRRLTSDTQEGGAGPSVWDNPPPPLDTGGSFPAQEESHHSDTSDQSASFLREVELLSNLRHPNVLLYMGACVKATAPLCIVSEHVVGGSLHDNLHGAAARSKLISTPSDRLLILLDVARGMLYLHSLVPVLLHRDLKSSNILVDSTSGRGGAVSRVKAVLCDFGLSRLDNSPTQREGALNATSLVGTLISMAPEVILQERYTSCADVFSFGVIMWEVWTGRVPHEGMMPVQLMFQVAVKGARPPIEPGSMPTSIADLIRRCWDTNPATRPPFLDVVRALQQIGRQELGLQL